ncbi:cell division protein FtsL [Spongiibacter sp.]|uniref:cell division protein FtsL n=1 Tax=Spongiibacter sp. TaxID=2024860 RepID=UPI003563A09C
MLVPLLLILVIVSALALIQSSHRSRKLFSELQDLRREAMQLDEEWGRLLLEQSTWASPDRVQSLAEDKLEMKAPDMREVKMVRGYGKAA